MLSCVCIYIYMQVKHSYEAYKNLQQELVRDHALLHYTK
jgi:hypothetical protein